MTDANSNVATNTYDNNGRLLTSANGKGETTTYAYDATGKKGLLHTKTNARSSVTTYSYNTRNLPSSTTYPDSTTESWSYDDCGRLLTKTDKKSVTTSFQYDAAGRMTKIDYPNPTTDTTFGYDNANRRTSMVDSTGTTTWAYDNANRCTSITAPNGTVTYGYDDANQRTIRALTGTGTWSYSFDDGGRVTSTTNPYSETTTVAYNAVNQPTTVTNANSSVTLYGYDTLHRTNDVWHKTGGGTTLGRYQYTFDAAGNVDTRTDNDGSVTTFGYDAANQLTSESRTNPGSYSITYTYDANGNRLTKVLNGTTETYTYDANDHLLTAGGKTYSYDNNGNTTSVVSGGNTTTLTWSVDNRLKQITYPNASTNTFAYNELGLRVQKVDSGGTKNFVTDGAEVASPVLSDGAAVYSENSERRSGTSKWLHSDALGSTRGITNSSQTATDSVLYDAFGMTLSRTGTTPTPFGFAGGSQYQSDPDSGLQLLGHRYYDPSTGRFISEDPAGAGRNWYAYCRGNPMNRIDPLGLFEFLGGEFTWEGTLEGLKTGAAALGSLVGIDPGEYRYKPGFGGSQIGWGVGIGAAGAAIGVGIWGWIGPKVIPVIGAAGSTQQEKIYRFVGDEEAVIVNDLQQLIPSLTRPGGASTGILTEPGLPVVRGWIGAYGDPGAYTNLLEILVKPGWEQAIRWNDGPFQGVFTASVPRLNQFVSGIEVKPF